MLRAMITDGEQPLMLLALLSRQCRQVYDARLYLDAGTPQAAIAGKLGIPPFAMRQLAPLTKMYTVEELADMVMIGYSTGLRLSDVAWLEQSEIEADGRFLSVVPNKTHLTKPIPLKVPLVDQVRNLILRRRTSPPDGAPYLFSDDARHRPSRKIAAAFKSSVSSVSEPKQRLSRTPVPLST